MYQFKVGDKCKRRSPWYVASMGWGEHTVSEVRGSDEYQEVQLEGGAKNVWWLSSRFDLVQTFKEVPLPSATPRMEDHKAAHRANDRDTAVAAAAEVTPTLSAKEQRVYEQIVAATRYSAGATGKEIARATGLPLNTVTPRFAPLQRKGLIKDSGVRSDRQIVWRSV